MPSSVMPTPRQAGTPAPAAVSAIGLRKAYGDKTVLDGIDLYIPAGSVFALLGPNGAGKTTTVQILSTLIAADGGQAQVAGHDVAAAPDRVRSAIGVTGQFAALDDLLTAEENLLLMADLLRLGKREGKARAGELLERFDIADVAHKRAATFSGGMRRRLDIAMTLVGDPQVIFLDEPTTGLDPRSRRTMWEMVRALVAGGTTVFLTTQYLEEADQLADRIAVLDGGRIVAEGTADELKARIPGSHVRLRFTDPAAYERAAAVFPGAARDADDLALRVAGDGGLDALRGLLDRLDAAGIRAADLSVHTPDLDDVFLALTGNGTAATPLRMKETSR
ncbi:ATP-binding cassette domain-containing protein [Streptomyces tricolor]|uniref:ATP-binding cassette domain-containing protein n=4 Tax=Streptomyces TaxID=1883 RepID=A0ABS9JT36_9ACTN|nr:MULTISPECIES: ATP-binding cassette domain-containing protein [Streptomyces]MCG0068742.1 ATP-binding cassette domain-containing protein [Streptomyces tricolor]CUW29203.1 Daunorubicin/doxorubicin resistance ATP-binding protein DrrA [Streptomyces reticuli]